MCFILILALCAFLILLIKPPATLVVFLMLIAIPFAGSFVSPRFSRRFLEPCSWIVALFYGLVFLAPAEPLVFFAGCALMTTLTFDGLGHLKAHVSMLSHRQIYDPPPISVDKKTKAACFDAIERALANIEFENDDFDCIRWRLTTVGKDRKFAFDDNRLEKIEAITARTEAQGWKQAKHHSILAYPKLNLIATASAAKDGRLEVTLEYGLRCEIGSTEVCEPMVKTTTEQLNRYLAYDVVPDSRTRFQIV